MASLFSSPPKPIVPPAAPQISQAMVSAEQSDDLLKRKMGVGTTILTGNSGLGNLGTTSAAKASGTT
jgi:hypothetical protein